MNLLMCPLLGHTVFFLFLVTCDASPSYYITTSGNTIYGTNTSLAVHWFGDNYADITVTAGIMDKSRLLVNASKVFYNDLIGILTVPAIPADSSSDSYTLVVNGSAQNTLVFSEKIQLYMQKKNISMFIQTDKTMYRSGESVKIRVISVRHDLKPYKGDVDLIIRDPKDNIVQQRLKMKSDLGVVSTQFLLSNNPMLGDWYIQATSDNSVNAVYFSVAEYVTPKFYATLDVPSFYISTKMLNLTGTVTAKYSYGKPLKGNVTISVKPSYEVEGNSEVSKTYEISGSVNFSFTHEEILNALYLGGMNVTATVTEELTGIVAKASTYVSRANSEYILNLIGQQQAFTPGLNFTAKVQVGRIDNKPLTIEERDEKVYVKITQSTGPYWISRVLITDDSTPDNSLILQYYSIKESDIINLEIPVLLSVQLIQVELEYQNTTQIFYFDKSYGTYPFIQIQTSNSSLKVGTSFNLQVNTYPKVEDVYYVVMAKGTVVSAGKNKTTFSLTPEQSWAPTAQLIVYFLNINGSFGDIVQTSEIFSILGTLKNKITLSWSKNTVGPLENVSLSVNVKESRSLVGLQVVEKSSGLLRNFTARRVDEELNLYYKGLLASITNAIIYNTYGFNIRQIEEVNPPRQVKLIFPETWIWLETNISSSLVTNLQFAVPDKNTSWVATAFVISEGLGLGITDGPAEISVVKPLFITFNMPFSLTRGEQFILEIILSNSLKENLQVMVTLESSNTFEIIVPNNNTGTVAGQQNVTVASEGAATVLFPVKPKVLGNITITVKATSKAASDVLTKTIIVKAEGVKNLYSQTALFEVLTTGNLNHMISKNFSFTFPSDVVEGSEEAFVTVIGDLLGPSINGLQSLILMPYGCGEQNMINFAPNIYILLYLTATKQIKADIQERAIRFMEQGYQTELTYMRNDGSFSAFGNSDNSGSTWLTAFVYRCFLQARPFIYINPDVLNGTVEWLVQFQDINTGIFSEPGRVIHKELQGGLNGPITLTAYILTSLLEDQYYSHRYASRVLKAVQYLEGKFDQGIASNYTLSVVVYALSLANSTRAEAALTQLNARASITGGTKYWSSPSETANYYWQPRTTDIETAAYALLSYYQQNRIAEGIPVMKWLSEQRNYLGGYSSTQDTVMALQALSQFVSVVPSSETSLTVTVTGPFVPKVFHINTNLLVLQSQQIEAAQPLLINVTAVGRGLAIVQLNVEYNRKASARSRRNTPVSEALKLDMTVKENSSNIQKLSVDVCMSYLGEDKESGMVILDFGFLSGFKLSPEGIPTKEPLKLVEPKDDKVYLYFDSLTNNEVCVSVPMVRFAKVAGSQDAVVSIYEYYNQRNTATRTYNSLTMKNISYCVFCGVNCTQCKSNVPLKTQTSSVTAPTFSMLWFCMVLLCYLL
ncbi:CD109 antigen-like isoform X2 [Mixophyes fleayi]|uniref:CD109 antigen-like isoform X2 n=1 Tax=Mixophyes fleayi TaxID=3061075 RepID=UPI003F4DE0D5